MQPEPSFRNQLLQLARQIRDIRAITDMQKYDFNRPECANLICGFASFFLELGVAGVFSTWNLKRI